ncbi:MAG: hypothetical protein K6U12_01935 [Armatimonadetes bacterium]|mgnify:CR=1 FL=1|nr:hypothetical protein [Armatimonadota bacterium]GBC90715.1 hypothetical protein HRbin14_01465 [bacterium HR14]
MLRVLCQWFHRLLEVSERLMQVMQLVGSADEAISECIEVLWERAERRLYNQACPDDEPSRRTALRLMVMCQWWLLCKALRLMGASCFPESLAKSVELSLSYLTVLLLAAMFIPYLRFWNILKARLAVRK